MSLWSRSVLTVYVAPNRVSVAACGGWLKRRPLHSSTWPCTLSIPRTSLWQAAIDTLRRQPLIAQSWKAVRVIVSDHFSRYVVFPGKEGVSGGAELMGYAKHKMRGVYGDVVDIWDLRISIASDGILVCGMDRELVSALRAMFSNCRPASLSIQPAFALTMNAHRNEISHESAWLVARDGTLAVIARLQGRQCRSIVTRRIRDASPAALFIALDRESRLQQLAEGAIGTVYLAGGDRSAQSCDYVHPCYRVRLLGPLAHSDVAGVRDEMAA